MTVSATKIEKQIASLQSKITELSRPHLTNTPKRQGEQRHRDLMAERYRLQMQALQYLEEETAYRDLSPFEQALLTSAFYEDMRGLLACKQYDELHCINANIRFPTGDDAMNRRLRKAGITDTAGLLTALRDYEVLMEKASVPENPTVAQIRDLTYQAQLQQGGDIHFTPPELVSKMIEAAGIDPDSAVLEPEAAIGNIADEVRKITPNVDCVEMNYDFRKLLSLKGHRVIGRDFLELVQQARYDAVLMNPPFSDDYRHIQHAYGFLKPGCVLVSVCADWVLHPPKARKHQEFQAWLKQQDYHISENNIRFEMTGIPTVLLTIFKPSEE